MQVRALAAMVHGDSAVGGAVCSTVARFTLACRLFVGSKLMARPVNLALLYRISDVPSETLRGRRESHRCPEGFTVIHASRDFAVTEPRERSMHMPSPITAQHKLYCSLQFDTSVHHGCKEKEDRSRRSTAKPPGHGVDGFSW